MLKYHSVSIMILLLLITGCAGEKEKAGGSGILEADEIVVSSEATGKVIEHNFSDGSLVSTGDTLLVVDPSKLLIQLETVTASKQVALSKLSSAKVSLEQAKSSYQFLDKEYKRISTLLKSGAGTTKQLDQIEHELTQANLNVKTVRSNIETIKAEIDQIDAEASSIQRMVDDSYPVSSIDGVVTEKFIDKGELLSPGKPIAKISVLSSLYVKVYLPAEDFAQVKLGDTALIDTETEGGIYEGVVTWTSEEAEFTPKNIQTKKSRANLVYAVKLKIENSDRRLKIGMPVYVTFENE